jgi:hypothetical protein
MVNVKSISLDDECIELIGYMGAEFSLSNWIREKIKDELGANDTLARRINHYDKVVASMKKRLEGGQGTLSGLARNHQQFEDDELIWRDFFNVLYHARRQVGNPRNVSPLPEEIIEKWFPLFKQKSTHMRKTSWPAFKERIGEAEAYFKPRIEEWQKKQKEEEMRLLLG